MKRTAVLFIFLFLSAGVMSGKMVELSNDFIKISVDDSSSRFALETVEGEMGNSRDNFMPLLYQKTPLTSFTTININGESVIFGSDSGNFLKRPYIDGKKIISGWEYNGILIVQEIGITIGASTGLDDTMTITYKLNNKSGRKIKAGFRILLDVLTGPSKPKGFGVPGQGTITRETQFFRDNIPPYWFIFDNFENPVIRAQGTLSGAGNTKPDRLVFAAWDRFYDNTWEFAVDSKRELRRIATPEFDSAAAVYYDPIDLEKDQSMLVSTSYGMYGTSFFTEKDMMLSLTVPNDPGHPPIPVSASFINQGKLILDRVQMEIFLPKGFRLSQDETNVFTFIKIETNREYSALWNLTSGSIGGNFKVKVRATAWNENISNVIESDQNFNINYVENPLPTNIVKKPEVKPVTVKPVVTAPVVTITNQMVVVDEVTNEASPEEEQLVKEINQLDKLIDEINKKYQVLMGIYKNVYKPDQKFMDEIEADLKKYQDSLQHQESILSNEKQLLRDE